MTTTTLTAAPKRTVILAEVAGFCFGVRRAVELTEKARLERNGKITTLGSLVHNEQVIAKLAEQGVGRAEKLIQINSGTVVLSAHGVAPATLREAKQQGLNVLDVTCPFVTKVHRAAKLLHEQGYQVILVGDEGHTEVRGVMGALEEIGGKAYLVSKPEQIAQMSLDKKVGVVSQTTQMNDTLGAIVAEICKRASEVRVMNTICNATEELQEAAVRLSKQVEVVLVIGGSKSANSNRLRSLCEAQGVPAYRIETEAEIQEGWLEGKTRIGITAGASTPDWMIENVAKAVNGGFLPENWRLHHPDE